MINTRLFAVVVVCKMWYEHEMLLLVTGKKGSPRTRMECGCKNGTIPTGPVGRRLFGEGGKVSGRCAGQRFSRRNNVVCLAQNGRSFAENNATSLARRYFAIAVLELKIYFFS